jgi:AAA+ superfamily predicted ATPase
MKFPILTSLRKTGLVVSVWVGFLLLGVFTPVVFGELFPHSIAGDTTPVTTKAVVATIFCSGVTTATYLSGRTLSVIFARVSGQPAPTKRLRLIGSVFGGVGTCILALAIALYTFTDLFFGVSVPETSLGVLLSLVGAVGGFGFLYRTTKSQHQTKSPVDRNEIDQKQRLWNGQSNGGPRGTGSVGDAQSQENCPSPDEVGRQHNPNPGELDSQQPDTGNSKNTNTDNTHPTSMEDLSFNWQTETDTDMTDVGGMDSLKQDLKEDVIIPLTSGKERAERFDIPIPNILFHGPPGTGKTHVAKALANEINYPFVKISGSDVTSKWVNESSEKVSELFDEAKLVGAHTGGAVIFIDELDSVLGSRSGENHNEDRKVVNEFLNKLSDIEDENILFIGSTNKYGDLDTAGIRSGRIDKEVYIGEPDPDARKAIIETHLDDRPSRVSGDELTQLAERSDGLVAADLEQIVVDAARQAAFKDGDEYITYTNLRDALAEFK